MGVNFTPQEGWVLYRLWAEDTPDIVLKTDRDGYLTDASDQIEAICHLPPGESQGRHLREIVHPACAEAVVMQHNAAIAGRPRDAWVECPMFGRGRGEHWYEIRSRALIGDDGHTYGAISILRCLKEKRSLEERLFSAAMTDPLTGLTNRRAFVAMLQHLVDRGVSGRGMGGCLALFDIDHFRAMNLRHGHAMGDEVLVIFADLVRTLTGTRDIISRIGGESFAVLLPGSNAAQAEATCRSIVETLSGTGGPPQAGCFVITASAGVSRIGDSFDETLGHAELALTVAKARGRNRVEMARDCRSDLRRLGANSG